MASEPLRWIASRSDRDFIVENLDDGLVVFNRATNKAHLLSREASAVFQAARIDARVPGVEIDEFLKTQGQERAVVEAAAIELQEAGLVTTNLSRPSRRKALARLGQGIALPLVVTLMGPSPAAAASNLANWALCPNGASDTCATPGRLCLAGPFSMILFPQDFRCCVPVSGQNDGAPDGFICISNQNCCSSFCNLGTNACVGN